MKAGFSMNYLKKYLKNTGWLALEQLSRLITGVLVSLWVARYLGPEDFGSLNFIIAFLAIFGSLSKLGMDEIIVKRLVLKNEINTSILATAFKARVIGASLIILLIILCLNFITLEKELKVLIIISSISFLFQSIEVLDLYFQSIVRVEKIIIFRVIQLFLSGIIKVLLILINADLRYFALMILTDSIILFSLYLIPLFHLKQLRKFFFGKIDVKTIIKVLNESWPLVLSSIVVAIYMRIDQVMIKNLLNSTELGIYSAAVRISELFYFIPMIIATSIFPSIVELQQGEPKRFNKRVLQFYTLMAWLAIIFGISTSIFGEFLIEKLYGPAYIVASSILKIHIWSAIFVFLGVAFNKVLLSQGLTKIAFKRTLLGAIINVILNYILIPKFGIFGAAYSTLIAQFIANLGYDIFDSKIRLHFLLKIKAIFLPFNSFMK